MKKADWYFDFISPFAYIGLRRLQRFSGRLDIRYRPVLFAALLDHWENIGPAEIAPKRAWTFRWCTWWAGHLGIPFRMPAAHPFNPLPYLRLSIAAGNSFDAVGKIFDAIWTTGVDAADERAFAQLAKSLGVDPERLAAREVKDALRTQTDQAIALGVFGVPTLSIDQELFWGADAMDFVEAWLADPGIVKTPEMQRAATLPVGVSRKRT
jgi:2-hydroxychromene-2-carboxylate isomerase